MAHNTCSKCKERPAVQNSSWCRHCRFVYRKWANKAEVRARIHANDRKLLAKLKAKVYSHYGNKCACCGEAHMEFLTVDHIDGNHGGWVYSKTSGLRARRFRGPDLYRWIIANAYPSTIRILCYNCNCARGRCGYCPHEKEAQLGHFHGA